jgi:hypothetical protein
MNNEKIIFNTNEDILYQIAMEVSELLSILERGKESENI